MNTQTNGIIFYMLNYGVLNKIPDYYIIITLILVKFCFICYIIKYSIQFGLRKH